ncbi:MAG: F0F1 ATP synthase subunit A [Chloroflexi bacterium]|nr:F0F1 ATP synthase subunit A [Chloroflexota bacterium]
MPPQPVLAADAQEAEEAHKLPDRFIITNTLLSSWIATGLLLLLFWLGARGVKDNQAPRGIANMVEAVVETMYGFVEGIAGRDNTRKFFPLFATIFIFVTFNAWLGLLPIYPTLGFIEDGEVVRHLLRPAGTDLNMPLAIAVVSFVFVEFWGIRSVGLGYFGKFFRLGSLLKGQVIDFFVGILELISEFIRLVSFTFRLFGNMTAGEILLLVFTFLLPFSFPLLFYGLELLVGLIQGLIFSGLTLVFVTLAIQPHGGEGEHGGH